MTARLAAALITDDKSIQPQVERLLRYLTENERLGVLERVFEYELASHPRPGQPRIERAVTVAIDSLHPLPSGGSQ